MRQLSFLLLWAVCVGLSVQQPWSTTTPPPPIDPCHNYSTLSQPQRNMDHSSDAGIDITTICDQYRFAEGEWYRFDHNVTGGRMPESCVSAYNCGTHVPIWMNGNHPNAFNPGPKTVQVCGNRYMLDQNSSDCCGWSQNIQVKYCWAMNITDLPYFVYQLQAPPFCEAAYCTIGACKPGYARNISDYDNCEDIDECLGDPCPWNSICVNNEGSYTCISDQTQNTTTPAFNDCGEMICVSGYCTESYSEGAKCNCWYGYTGQYCDTYMPCYENPCGPGWCNITTSGDYNCTCPPGVYGRNCTEVDCGYNPCVHGYCAYGTDNKGYCECDDEYEGVTCENYLYGNPTTVLPTTTSPWPTTPDECGCQNGGSCNYYYDPDIYYTTTSCDCPYRYSGEYCEIAQSCLYHSCYNDGTCNYDSEVNEYKCDCPEYTYGHFCENYYPTSTTSMSSTTTYDMCGCENGGSCDYPYSYTCTCSHGYTGQKCETAQPCSYIGYTCYNGGSCEYSYYYGDYRCECPDNTYGEFCENMYSTTTPMPSPSTTYNACGCENGGTCGYYTDSCYCPAGYSGEKCEIGLPCSTIGYTCYNGGSCMYSYYTSDYQCSCMDGSYGHFCENQAVQNVTHDYFWSTTTAYPYPGECNGNPCYNGGRCISLSEVNDFCYCREGFTGAWCETYEGDYYGLCEYNHCLNGGSCFNMADGDYTCVCPGPNMGLHCEELPTYHNACATAYCNHGRCVAGIWSDDYTCLCDPDWTGTNCEIPEHYGCDCVHGTCTYHNYYYDYVEPYPNPDDYYNPDWDITTPDPSSYRCQCNPGYQGEYCEDKIESCYDEPCMNGGTCDDSYYYSGFSCMCTVYYEGEFCEKGIWGDWYDQSTCSRSCGGGYTIQRRECLAGPGKCNGSDMHLNPCNAQPCTDGAEAEKYGLDVVIDIDDAPLVTQNEHHIPLYIAKFMSDYCRTNRADCCWGFGYAPKYENYMSLVDEKHCYFEYVEVNDVSLTIQVTAATTKQVLGYICEVDGYDYDDYDMAWDTSDLVYVRRHLLRKAVEANIDNLKNTADVDVLEVRYSSERLVDDPEPDFYYEEEEEDRKGLIIGLSVALGLLAVIVCVGVTIIICKCCMKPKNRSMVQTPQPVPAVARPQTMYAQPQTPHDLFLASGANGAPPTYQQAALYTRLTANQPPAYGIGVENPGYASLNRNTALPPIHTATAGKQEATPPQKQQPIAEQKDNKAPPSANVYHFQAPPTQPANRLPPIQQAPTPANNSTA